METKPPLIDETTNFQDLEATSPGSLCSLTRFGGYRKGVIPVIGSTTPGGRSRLQFADGDDFTSRFWSDGTDRDFDGNVASSPNYSRHLRWPVQSATKTKPQVNSLLAGLLKRI